MIYLEKTGQDVFAFIPKVYGGDFDGRAYSLEAFSTVDRSRFVFDNLFVDDEKYTLYYEVRTAVPEAAPTGEYEYILKDGAGKVISSGLLVIFTAERNPETVQNENEIKYTQYGSK